MFRLPRPSPASAGRPPSPLRRAALFGGGLVCLWGALQLAPLPAEPPAEAPPAAVAPFPAVAPPVAVPPVETPPVVEPVAGATPVAAVPTTPVAEGLAPVEAASAPAAVPAVAPTAVPTPPSAARPAAHPLPERPAPRRGGLFRFGNVVAFLLLAGGGAFAYVLHRKKHGVSATVGAAPAMGVLGELSLGPGQAVRLVRVHDEVLVLGVAQTGVTLLHRYPYEALRAAAATVDADAPEADAPAGAAGHARLFADVLRQYVPAASAHA